MIVRVFAFYFLSGCFSSSFYAQVSPRASVSKKRVLDAKPSAKRSGQHLQVSLLQGYWSDNAEDNAIFWIEGKRVFFFDHISDTENEKKNLTYWSVSNNKLSFHYSGGLVVTDDIIKLTKDSLVLYRRDKKAGVVGYSRYVRLK